MYFPNADLAARDPTIPGLDVVLDGSAFRAALHARLPAAGIQAAHPRYVRYKPGSNCTVAYTLATANHEFTAYARAYAAPLRGKLDHARRLVERPGPLGPAGFVLEPLDIAVYSWPIDHELPTLHRIADKRKRKHHLAALGPAGFALEHATLHTLRYKPERRYVGLLQSDAGLHAVVRLYTPGAYDAVHNAIRASAAVGLRTPRLLAADDAAHLLLLEWLPGQTLAALLDAQPAHRGFACAAGAALAELHHAPLPDLPLSDPRTALGPAVAAIAALDPTEADRAAQIAATLTTAFSTSGAATCLIHGDLYADQMLLNSMGIALIDLDNAALGDPAADLGSWIAHRYRTESDAAIVRHQASAFLEGYSAAGGRTDGVATHVAAHLLRLAAEPFRYCAPDWPHQLRRLLDRAEEYLHHAPLAV